MPTPVTLLVAYPKELIRAGLRSMLAGSSVKIIGEASDASSTLSLAKKHKPAVVLLDAAISGGDAFDLVATLGKTMQPRWMRRYLMIPNRFDLALAASLNLRLRAQGF